MIKSNYINLSIIAGAAVLMSSANAQISYNTEGVDYTEDFNDGLPFFGSRTWTDNSTFDGFYAQDDVGDSFTQYFADSTNAIASRLYQARSNSTATDGALGTKPGTGSGDIILGMQITNNTGVTLNSFSLGYLGEQWYESSSANLNSYIVSYQLGSPADLLSGSWTEVSALQFDTPQTSAASSVSLNGSLAANQTAISSFETVGLSWADGTDLWIRWFDENNPGVDDTLAIDDVIFSATSVPEPSAYALILSMSVLAIAATRRRKS